jgi:DNA-binding HxlR family transcriptional regulator
MPMGFNVMSRTCPSRVVLHRIGARWTVFIVNALEHGPKRFVELKTHIQGITPKVLTETLRTLERDGLIARTDYEENPPRVEYELTELGRSLLEPLRAVRRWAEAHVPEIQAANAAAAAMEPGGR